MSTRKDGKSENMEDEISYIQENGTFSLSTIPGEATQKITMLLPESFTPNSSVRELASAAIVLADELVQTKETYEETRNRHKAMALESEKGLSRQRAEKFIRLGIVHNDPILLVGGLLKRFEIDHCGFRPIGDSVMLKSLPDKVAWLKWHLNGNARGIIKSGCFNSDMKGRSLALHCDLASIPIRPIVKNGFITGIDWEHEEFIEFLVQRAGYNSEAVEFTHTDWRIDAMGYGG